MKLLVATHNPGKIREYQALLADLPLAVTWLDAEQIAFDVEETGSTFAENALLKARAYAEATGLWTWADDSGLEIDALDGRPGVFSARYAGPGATDADRYNKVLAELAAFPPEAWTARFRCAVALVEPSGRAHVVEADFPGMITTTPRGAHGFGYDPIFYLPELGQTLAELPPEVKNRISHRAQAAQAAHDLLLTLVGHVS
jgi:XTP/dITP diphosphohydrolase